MSRYLVESKINNGKELFWIYNTDTLILEKLSSKYLKHRGNENRSPHTIKANAFALAYYLTFLDESKLTVSDVLKMPYATQFEHFSNFMNWIKSGRHSDQARLPDNNTCNKYLSEVFGFLIFLLKDQNVDGDLKVFEEKEASYFSGVGIQFKRMVAHFDGFLTPNEHKKREISEDNFTILLDGCTCLRDKVILIILAETGMRIGELLGLNYVKDIDYDNKTIFIKSREDNENRARAKYCEERSTYISEETLQMLQCYLAENSDLLCKTENLIINLHGKTAGKAMKYSTVQSMLSGLKKRTGIKFNLHMLRHYFANSRRKAGWDLTTIMTALGHRNIQTTVGYLSVPNDEMEAASKEYFEKNKALYDVKDLL